MSAATSTRNWITTPAELAAADGETLVKALEILTHRIHTATGAAESDLRGQRLIVRNEILRRMGEPR